MEQKFKKLKHIIPFNKFIFISCYYHQIIAAYSHFGVEDSMILINNLPLYYFANGELSVQRLALFDNKLFEQRTRVHRIIRERSKGIVNELINSVKRGMPCIVAVDCFYLPNRRDTFQKDHRLHYLLVYGYDLTTEEFIVNEHSYLNSAHYGELHMPFSDLETAYLQYESRLAKKGRPAIYKFKRIDKNYKNLSKSEILLLFDKHKEEIKNSYCEFKKALLYYSDLVGNKKYIAIRVKNLIELFIGVRWFKTTQKDIFTVVFQNEKIVKTMDSAIEDYLFIIGVLTKYRITKRWKQSSIEAVQNRFQTLIRKERIIHGYMIGKQ